MFSAIVWRVKGGETMRKWLGVLGSFCLVVLFGGTVSVWADGVASWSKEQYATPRPLPYWQDGNIVRFVYCVEKADWEYQDQGWEAAHYWAREAERARHHTVSYYVDVGDLHYRMGSKRDALTYYQLARSVKRKNVEDHVELGEAFLNVQEPGLADFYFTEAMKYARSRSDWLKISEGFAHIGNKHMAEITKKRAMELR